MLAPLYHYFVQNHNSIILNTLGCMFCVVHILSVVLWESNILVTLSKTQSCDVIFSHQVKPLIWIESVIEKHSHSRIEYMIKVRHP